MQGIKKFKLILFALILVVFIGVLYKGINVIERKFSRTKNDDDIEYDEDDYEDEYELTFDDIHDGQLLIDGKIYEYNAAVRNYLVIGTDYSGSYKDTDNSDYKGNMADVLLLVVLNRSDNNYAVLEIDRNTVINVPIVNDEGEVNARSMMQICTAHGYGASPQMSSENTVRAVSELLGGMPIDGYYELNMDTIEHLNHAIGGVTLTVEGDFSEVDETLIDGATVTLTDKQAYNYVHERKHVNDGTNENRMKRQEQYIRAMLDKLVDRTAEDPGFPNVIYKDMKNYALTDMTGNDFSRILNRVSKGENLGLLSFKGEYKIGKLINDNKELQEFYVDEKSRIEVLDKLYDLSTN